MDDFNLNIYMDIVFRKNAENELVEKIKQYDGSKILLVYGGNSIKSSGLYSRVTDLLKKDGMPFFELGGVQPNPLLSLVYQGIELVKKEKINFLVAVGGGSVIDTAKAICLGSKTEIDIWEIIMGNKDAPALSLPLGVIHTIASSGSETSRSFAVVKEESRYKQGYIFNQCRPCFTLMNPELMYTLPSYSTAVGACDVFAHAFERYFHPGCSYLGHKLAEGVLKAVVKYTPLALSQPQNYEAQSELMLASSFAHNDILGVGKGDIGLEGACHTLETPISATYDKAHGEGLAVLMPIWMEYVRDKIKREPFVRFAINVFDVESDPADKEWVIDEGIRRFRKWLESLKLPLTLVELGLDEKSIPVLMDKLAFSPDKTVGSLVKLKEQDIRNIYQAALRVRP